MGEGFLFISYIRYHYTVLFKHKKSESAKLRGLRGCVCQNKICVGPNKNCVGPNKNCVGLNNIAWVKIDLKFKNIYIFL